tara:strand:+ start:479 stop:1075 length:597 start_codon:yes stop_codon:yes gene_type:complete
MEQALTKKQRTHQRMLDAAGQSFRSNGYAGIGVDGIAKAAGVTSGAFYAHFGSKDGAFEAALKAGLDEVIDAVPTFQRDHGGKWVEGFADYYLGKAHRKDLACGCAMTSLSPEIARAAPDVRAIYETKMKNIVDLIADGLAGRSREDRIARAWAVIGTLIGGLTVARAVKTQRLSEEIASSIRTAAGIAAGEVRKDCS